MRSDSTKGPCTALSDREGTRFTDREQRDLVPALGSSPEIGAGTLFDFSLLGDLEKKLVEVKRVTVEHLGGRFQTMAERRRVLALRGR